MKVTNYYCDLCGKLIDTHSRNIETYKSFDIKDSNLDKNKFTYYFCLECYDILKKEFFDMRTRFKKPNFENHTGNALDYSN